MFGVLVCWIYIGIVLGAAVAAGDYDSMPGYGLDMVQQLDQDGIDKLLLPFDRQAVLVPPAAVLKDLLLVSVGGVHTAPFTAEMLPGDWGQCTLIPRIGGGRISDEY